MKRNLAFRRAVWHSSAANYDNTGHLVTENADIPWISGGNGEEWLLFDLGAASEISEIVIRWGEEYAGKCRVEVSDDAERWTLAGEYEVTVPETRIASLSASGRYVKLFFTECSGAHYIVNRVEILGENSLDGSQPETPWRVERAAEVIREILPELQEQDTPEKDAKAGALLSLPSFDDSSWLPAVVPGTVLNSYVQAGAVPDPFYDDDQFQASEAFFTADFWYRTELEIPEERRGQRVFLNFQEINWKADIFLNGVFLPNEHPECAHSIEGEFIRAKFDVTDLVHFGKENALAVLIHQNDTPGLVTTQGLAYGPGPNGGLLGADNPTCHAAVGWDWLPTIRGRNIGIIGDVTLSYGGDVLLKDPWMETGLRLLSESTAIPVEDLMLREGVRTRTLTSLDASAWSDEPLRDWRGTEGSSLITDLGAPSPVGAITLLWGAEEGGPAADADSRHPAAFRMEASLDGEHWQNLDAYPGGKVPVRWFGLRDAEANSGTDSHAGHAISDTLPGATAIVPLDFRRFGRGIEDTPIVQPQDVRFLRFTVLKARELNGKAVDTILSAMHVYPESPEAVEQATKHNYALDTEKAELVLHTELQNLSKEEKTVRLVGRILPPEGAPSDALAFSREVRLGAKETLPVTVPLVLENPLLWWPNTYGEQPLYTCDLRVLPGGAENAFAEGPETARPASAVKVSAAPDQAVFRFGVRRFDSPIEGGLLTLYCNGVRIVCKGGNWGLDDGMKKDTREILFDKIRLHKEANMTMIRNWVGMTSHPAFYEACDEYGILIWDDFWLANPYDGPNPEDPEMFLRNASDKIRQIRSHASLAFYCGRNEGNPPEEINEGLKKLTKELDGTRIYFPHSAAAPVGSGGGYSLAKPGADYGVKQYFNDVTSSVLRSERGLPNVPEFESAMKFLRPSNLWPISESWALHDWTYHLNGPANTYMEAMKKYLDGDFEVPLDHVQGAMPSDEDPVYREYKAAVAKMVREAAEAWNCNEFFTAAQLIDYDHHRGMFDALSARLSNGLLMWMSQSSWPSFMWQTYDYYLNTNGGYFGVKAGCQPTRALFDPRNDRILLANATPKHYKGLTVTEELYNLYGKQVFREEIPVEELPPDAYGIPLGIMDFSASDTDLVFLRLRLTDSEGKVLGENTYWHNRKEYQNYLALREVPKTSLQLKVLSEEAAVGAPDRRPMRRFTLEIENGSAPAPGVRVRLLSTKDAPDDAVLPVFWSDNYLLMMPGERRIITAECYAKDLQGEAVFEIGCKNLN